MIIDGRYKTSEVGVPCGTKFFADWAFFFCFAELIFATSLQLGVVKQECSGIVRWRDFISSKLCQIDR